MDKVFALWPPEDAALAHKVVQLPGSAIAEPLTRQLLIIYLGRCMLLGSGGSWTSLVPCAQTRPAPSRGFTDSPRLGRFRRQCLKAANSKP